MPGQRRRYASQHRPLPLLRLALAVGLVVTGWWAVQIFPPLAAMLLPISVLTAQATEVMLGTIGLPVVRELNLLSHSGGFAGEIDFTCTALVPAALLGAVVFAWPATWRARITGALAGVLLVILLNQLRLVSLISLGVLAPYGFNAAHTLLWPVLMLIVTTGYVFYWARAVRR